MLAGGVGESAKVDRGSKKGDFGGRLQESSQGRFEEQATRDAHPRGESRAHIERSCQTDPISREKSCGRSFVFRSRRTRRQGIKERGANDPAEKLHERKNRGTEGTQGADEEHSEPEKVEWRLISVLFASKPLTETEDPLT